MISAVNWARSGRTSDPVVDCGWADVELKREGFHTVGVNEACEFGFQRLLTFPCIGLPLYLFANLPYCSTEKRSAGTCRSPCLLTHKAEATAVQADPTINRANRKKQVHAALWSTPFLRSGANVNRSWKRCKTAAKFSSTLRWPIQRNHSSSRRADRKRSGRSFQTNRYGPRHPEMDSARRLASTNGTEALTAHADEEALQPDGRGIGFSLLDHPTQSRNQGRRP